MRVSEARYAEAGSLAEAANDAEMHLAKLVLSRNDSELTTALIDCRIALLKWFDAYMKTSPTRPSKSLANPILPADYSPTS